MGSGRPQRVAGLAWAGSAEAASRRVACSGGRRAPDNARQWWQQQIFHRLVSVFCERGPAGAGARQGTGGSGSLTVPLSATSPPSLPLRTDSQLRPRPLGPWAPWQDLSEVLGGSGLCPCAMRCVQTAVPSQGCLCCGPLSGARQGPVPHPSSAQRTPGGGLSPLGGSSGPVCRGTPSSTPSSGRGTAGSWGGWGAWAGLHPPTLNRP